MAIPDHGTDVKDRKEPVPRDFLRFFPDSLQRTVLNWFGGQDRMLGEIVSGVNRNRQNIVQLETDYQASDGALSTAYIAADAVVAADAESARATLSTTLTTAYTAADTALQGTLQADIDTRATIVYVDSVESSLSGSIAAQYSTITAEYTAITDGIAGDVSTNAASIASEASARASGDSANASSITTLEASVNARQVGENLLVNPSLSDVTTATSTTGNWPGSGSAPFYTQNPNLPLGWLQLINSSVVDPHMFALRPPNTQSYLPEGVAGFEFFQNGATASGYQEVQSVPIPCSSDQRVGAACRVGAHRCTATLFVFFYDEAGTYLGIGTSATGSPSATNSGTGNNGTITDYTLLTRFVTPNTGAKYMRFVIRKSYTSSGSNSYLFASCFQLMFVDSAATALPPFNSLTSINGLSTAKITQIAEAYATNSSATARLVWTVNTSTNAATIEQTAAEGYSDGTWNGSAISLTADEIRLTGDVILDGGLSVTGYLASDNYTVPTSLTTIGSVIVERRLNPIIFEYTGTISNSRSSGTGGSVKILVRLLRNGSLVNSQYVKTFRTPAGESDDESFSYRYAKTSTGPASSSTDTFALQIQAVVSGTGWSTSIVEHSWLVEERLSGPQAFGESDLASDIISAGSVSLPDLY